MLNYPMCEFCVRKRDDYRLTCSIMAEKGERIPFCGFVKHCGIDGNWYNTGGFATCKYRTARIDSDKQAKIQATAKIGTLIQTNLETKKQEMQLAPEIPAPTIEHPNIVRNIIPSTDKVEDKINDIPEIKTSMQEEPEPDTDTDTDNSNTIPAVDYPRRNQRQPNIKRNV